MATPFLGEVKLVSFNFPPRGWASCDGQFMPINQNQALFSLLGTMYGGNGQTTFALPDLRGRVPLHVGGGFLQGVHGGETAHTLLLSELPAHSHLPTASSNAPDAASPEGGFWANSGRDMYGTTADSPMSLQAIAAVGGSQPHENQSPFLVLNFCIALVGIFPSQN